jgi:hypothetical protein
MLAPEARREIEKLIEPKTLAIVAGVLVAWVVSHLVGIGEIVDAILIGAGILAVGLSVFEVRPFLPELGGLCAGGFIFAGVPFEYWWSPTQPKAADTSQ